MTTQNNQNIKTRFAPSPTGFLHIGGARTALFCWAFARHSKGKFVLRIEDTDLERSFDAATQGILDGMAWLNLDYDEGPFYQTQRMQRYKEVLDKMLADGTAYYCYTTKEELDAARQADKNFAYDRKWRPEQNKALPPIPEGVKPVIRFKNPLEGSVVWDDLVKGRIEVANSELDDLIIARNDGTPTYNFCVVVDDFDMGITHVLRGDDHVSNTPRQINILKALGANIPVYGHLSMILGEDGKKLSKRHGAVSVMQYEEDGYLPETLINYLARLGWSHGDVEIFSREELISWFNLEHITPSAAQFDFAKLKWLNQHYIKQLAEQNLQKLSDLVADKLQRLYKISIKNEANLVENFQKLCLLYADRSQTINELAENLQPFFEEISEFSADKVQKIQQKLSEIYKPEAKIAMADLLKAFSDLQNQNLWAAENINAAIKTTFKAHKLKMPHLAIPLRVALLGVEHTPSVDIILQILGFAKVQAAINKFLL